MKNYELRIGEPGTCSKGAPLGELGIGNLCRRSLSNARVRFLSSPEKVPPCNDQEYLGTYRRTDARRILATEKHRSTPKIFILELVYWELGTGLACHSERSVAK